MKSNLAVILAILACAGLGVVLWQQNQSHAVQTQELDKKINSQSKHVSDLEATLAEERIVRTTLETNLVATRLKDSNDLATIAANLSATEASLEKAKAAEKFANDAVAAAAASILERDNKIKALEDQKAGLDKESGDLHAAITNLEAEIKTTQKKLDASEGDKNFLLAELKRLEAQKQELERKLSDLASLQEQVRVLKENLSIARRLDWIRQGLYSAISQKGGEHLLNPLPSVAPPANTNRSLDVELHERGPARINSPAATNAPPARGPSTNPPSAR